MKINSKISIPVAAAVAALATGCTCGNVSGTISGIEADSLVVRAYVPISGTVVSSDTLAVTEGKFTAKVPDSTAVIVRVFTLPKEGEQPRSFSLMEDIVLVPGDKIKISGSMDSTVFSSPKLYDKLESFTERTELFNKIDDILASAQEMDPNDQEALIMMRDSIGGLFSKKDTIYAEYVKANPGSVVAAYCATQIEDDKLAVDAISSIEETAETALMKARLDDCLEYHQSNIRTVENQEKIKAGKPAPDFSLKDTEGNIKTLASFQGKYMLLDFWGTWCYWCMKGMPEMKNYYAKYSDKIEFVGVNCGDTEEAWLKAVQEEGLTWTNLFNGRGTEITESYAIQGYPTKILIDPEGVIVEVYIGEVPTLYEKLDELF